ncbi:MAG: VPLPA-CTERM sorting domain-containing protein [Proteobacteria bacterium]|nr:VPLPA-CTERM sorting domain-containing protein [Pseudomonadota bacterium]
MRYPSALVVALATLSFASASQAATLPFASTSDTAAWQVATNLSDIDGGPFPTSGFVTASRVDGRVTEGINWLANNTSGSNGGVGNWTQFVFRQSFDLTGFNAADTELEFQWAADDSGEIVADRGHWVPKFSLNGGALVPWGTGPTYNFGPVVTVNSGFVAGLNHIDFFVQGNGQTDGFALKALSLTASPVPAPASVGLMLGGLVVLTGLKRRRTS